MESCSKCTWKWVQCIQYDIFMNMIWEHYFSPSFEYTQEYSAQQPHRQKQQDTLRDNQQMERWWNFRRLFQFMWYCFFLFFLRFNCALEIVYKKVDNKQYPIVLSVYESHCSPNNHSELLISLNKFYTLASSMLVSWYSIFYFPF